MSVYDLNIYICVILGTHIQATETSQTASRLIQISSQSVPHFRTQGSAFASILESVTTDTSWRTLTPSEWKTDTAPEVPHLPEAADAT